MPSLSKILIIGTIALCGLAFVYTVIEEMPQDEQTPTQSYDDTTEYDVSDKGDSAPYNSNEDITIYTTDERIQVVVKGNTITISIKE